MDIGEKIINNAELLSGSLYSQKLEFLTPQRLHNVIAGAVMNEISAGWEKSKAAHLNGRHAYYFSAEFLIGRTVYNNLLCLGLSDEIEKALNKRGSSLKALEDIEDAALGNGGLGRLAACFLDSAATLNLPLDGYGIRYKYGIFKQKIENGFQVEEIDDWTKSGDAWSIRRDEDTVEVKFSNQTVKAVPYDTAILGYDTDHISTLRLWQAESLTPFDFEKFNDQNYIGALREHNKAEDISRVLYPNDSTRRGKELRLKQQYFFCSASLQDIIRSYKKTYGNDFSHFAELVAVQLNDTHPVISIPELIRLLTEKEGVIFDEAFNIARSVFAYTNHTIMQEALEKWDYTLVRSLLPEIALIIKEIDKRLVAELKAKGVEKEIINRIKIIQGRQIHMAYLAVYVSKYINGVAEIHTEILKDRVLNDWYNIYPERFRNKTNGITQRRWLALCNRELSALITELLGDDAWKTDLMRLKELEKYADDKSVLDRFMQIKQDKRIQLKEYIAKHDNIAIDENSIYDIQIKRLHEYKRQFLNILAILELCFEIKEGSLTDFTPTTFIFGAKAAPGYFRAKGIIKLINEVAKLIENDEAVNKLIKVVFISDYNVSYAEKLVSAADVSEQISTAGTEASGTGNMKLMLNGAVTLGTFDGANIEIFGEAGEENNYVFGARVEDIADIKDYSPEKLCQSNPKIRRVMDSLINGTLDDGNTGMFRELYDSILKGASWHQPDQYYLLLDFEDYLNTKIRLNRDYNDRYAFAKKGWLNMANAGKFSSDRTISQYAEDIWKITSVK